jgi:hypothetical protein
MSSEIWLCPKCGREFDVYYSMRDECEIVSGSCKCSLQNRNDGLTKSHIKPLDRALEILNEKFKLIPRKISRKPKANR